MGDDRRWPDLRWGEEDVMASATRLNFRALTDLDAALEWSREHEHELYIDQYFPAIEEA
jgi:hypothetical protein